MDLGGLIILVALFALFWVFLIQPQRRRLNAQRELHRSIKDGDEIVTMGGLLGHVRGIDEDDDTLRVEIAPGTTVRVARQGVAAVITPADSAESESETGSGS